MRGRGSGIPERLAQLHDVALGTYELRLSRPRPHRFTGWWYFRIHLVALRECSREPVISGLFSAGGKGVQPWIDCSYAPRLTMDGGTEIDLHELRLDVPLFTVLADSLPADGHIMVEYESTEHTETRLGIRMQLPLAATQLGALLFEAGFRGGFKDWYFAEGGFEGAVKLQANKPYDAAHARTVTANICADLRAYLRRPVSALHPHIDERGRQRARALLTRLHSKRA